MIKNRFRITFFILVTILSILLVRCLTPAEAVELQGSILDDSNKPVIGYSVQVISTSTSNVYNATTDARGTFILLNLPPGAYTIKPSTQPETQVQVQLSDQKVLLDPIRLGHHH